MKKLTLDFENLEVTSFDTETAESRDVELAHGVAITDVLRDYAWTWLVC